MFITATTIVFGGLFLSDRFEVPSAFAAAFAVAVAFAAAFAGAVAGAGAFAFAVAFAAAGASAFAFAVAFAFAFAAAFAFAVFVETRIERFGHHPKRLIALICFYLLGLSLAIIFGQFVPSRTRAESVFLMLMLGALPLFNAMADFASIGALPLFNAMADFASIGLTRYLLRKGLTAGSSRRAIFDLCFGGVIFAALGCAIITWIHLVQPSDGPLIHLASFFTALRATPSDYWWLAVMLGSTLLPTILHGVIAVFTVLLTYPEPLRRWLVAKLESGATSETDGWQATWVICGLMTLAIWFPIFSGWLLWKMDHSAALNGLITFFEGYAKLIGAI